MDSLRKLLQRPRKPPDIKKGKEEVEVTSDDDDDKDDYLEFQPSDEIHARIEDIRATEIMPKALVVAESVYTTLALAIVDWLRQNGEPEGFQPLEDASPALNQEAEIAYLVATVAEKNLDIPPNLNQSWEECLTLRRRVIRFHETRVEQWDTQKQEMINKMQRFSSM